MSKEKLESDYQNFDKQVDQLADEAIKAIHEKANAVQEEARAIGESVAGTLNKTK